MTKDNLSSKINALLIASAMIAVLASCGGNGTGSQSGEITASSSTAIVQTQQGTVAGYVQDEVFIYKGIPYGKAERFMPATEPDSWEGIRNCRTYGPICPQHRRDVNVSSEVAFGFDWVEGVQNEDCPRLNVWTPGINDGKKRPVMVWIHGGAFSTGYSQELPSHDGTNLAKNQDVVVVSINHRLNVLGFLDLSQYGPEYEHSGNVGFLDIIDALKWVNKNIEAFGGDPSNVTIFGQSGGGGKVSALLASPLAEGLFEKAIVMSGSMNGTMESRHAQMIAAELLKELGLKPSQVDQLKTMPYEKLLEAGDRAVSKVRPAALADGDRSFIFGWAPIVDGDILPYQMDDPRAWETSKDIPLMIGTTKNEFPASLYSNPGLRGITQEQAVEYLKGRYGDQAQEFIDGMAQAYPDYKPLDLIDIDLFFRPMALRQSEVKLGVGGAPLYMYMFEWESPVMDGALRSSHSMDIAFVFDNAVRHAQMTGGGEDAVALAGKMSEAWAQFARTGDPNTDRLPQWEPYSEQGATMFFNNECHIGYNHDKALMDFYRSYSAR